MPQRQLPGQLKDVTAPESTGSQGLGDSVSNDESEDWPSWDVVWANAAKCRPVPTQAEREDELRRFARKMKKRGYIQPRTRSTFAWRMRERPYSAIRKEYLNPAIPNIDWDYAPVGESTYVRDVPRVSVGHTEEILIFAVHQHKSTNGRRISTPKKFYRMCEDARCEKQTCARCYAVEHLVIGKNESFQFRRIPLTEVRVSDGSGVDPSGNRPLGPPDPPPEEKALYSLVSTQKEYKKHSGNNW